jgi:hypothetical protein
MRSIIIIIIGAAFIVNSSFCKISKSTADKIKVVSEYVYKSSDKLLISKTYYNQVGQKERIEHFNSAQLSSIRKFTYDKDGLCIKIENLDSNYMLIRTEVADYDSDGKVIPFLEKKEPRCNTAYVKCEFNKHGLVSEKRVYNDDENKVLVGKYAYTYEFW